MESLHEKLMKEMMLGARGRHLDMRDYLPPPTGTYSTKELFNPLRIVRAAYGLMVVIGNANCPNVKPIVQDVHDNGLRLYDGFVFMDINEGQALEVPSSLVHLAFSVEDQQPLSGTELDVLILPGERREELDITDLLAPYASLVLLEGTGPETGNIIAHLGELSTFIPAFVRTEPNQWNAVR